MIKRAAELRHASETALRGGEGTVEMLHLVEKDEASDLGRTFAFICIPPGASIGYHQHVGEMEIYHIIKGCATVKDDDTMDQLQPGDSMVCYDGHYHSIANNSDEPLEFLALVLYTRSS